MAVIMASLCASVFVAALDITIIATATATIAGDLASPSGYQWIGSAFILTNTASTPSWGGLSDIWGRRPILLAAVAIFFAGSLICALSSSFATVIAGRAVQGLGAAGLTTLVNICVSDLFSLRDRGLYLGLTNFVWALAGAVGPVLGGVFAQQLNWRWCFWINLPISGIVFILLFFTLRLKSPKRPVRDGLRAIDWTGSLLIIGSTAMFLVGLDFGGVAYPWGSAVVVCLIVFGVLVGVLFVLNEWKVAVQPVVPLRLFRRPSNVAAYTMCFCHGFVFLGAAFYLPLYFQAVLGVGPLLSGVHLIPFIVSISLSGASTGLFIQRTGKYMVLVYIGITLTALGTGLFLLLEATTNWPRIIIPQLVAGIGVGMLFEPPLLAVQAISEPRDIATATSTFGFIRSLSSAISIIVGGVTFQNRMADEARDLISALGADALGLLGGGEAATHVEAVSSLPPDQRAIAREALTRALRTVWILYTSFAVASLVAGLFLRPYTLGKDIGTAIGPLGVETGDEDVDRSRPSSSRTADDRQVV
ncbi:MFS drug transporter [Lasiosphaeria miniovina]|uniref:Efflux pump dotC n=1 Tax=Lasiosphaeria miniovina TaxID=1954250 RepID=A0AA39ZUD0_9PEZI|nr:MFS drug transporter [Lasiosphaeria miniovina]KAK0703847.1 MFS drug transporter [Lasiosphaeria miniovina]